MKNLKLHCAALVCALMCGVAQAQTPPSTADPLELLPASDIVVDIHVRRILDEAMPRAMAKSPKLLAEMNRTLADLKARTGFDLRAVDRLVFGTTLAPLAGGSLSLASAPRVEEGLMILQGRFDAEALAAGARLLLNASETTHAGRALYTFRPDAARMKQFGVAGLDAAGALDARREGAFAVIDSGTVLFGTSASVRHALGGARGANQESVDWARQNAGTLLNVWVNTEAFTGRAAAGATAQAPRKRGGARGLQLDGMDSYADQSQSAGVTSPPATAPLEKAFASITRLYLSTTLNGNNFETLLTARTRTLEDAYNLNQAVEQLRQMFANNGNQAAGSPLDGLEVTTEDNLLRFRLRATSAEVASLMARMPPPGKSRAVGARPARRRRG